MADFGFEVFPEWEELGEELVVAAESGLVVGADGVVEAEDCLDALGVGPFAALGVFGEE